jgi:succinate dehydrogenase / fumarate reductase, cytochrome b subunit
MNSIAKKALMALTGLGLVGFLITHLAGNMYLFMGPAKFNAYAMFLEQNPFLIVAELGLLAIFLVHIVAAIKVTLANRAARPQSYEARETAGQSSFASRTMMLTGLVILFFVVIHVKMFKYSSEKEGVDGLWGHVIRDFAKPEVLGFYVVSMLALGLHLSHAIGSAFQSLGLRNDGGRPKLGGLGPLVGWGLALGFASLPLWAFAAKPQGTGIKIPTELKIEFPKTGDNGKAPGAELKIADSKSAQAE